MVSGMRTQVSVLKYAVPVSSLQFSSIRTLTKEDHGYRLKKNFQIVDQPGPDTLVIHAAVTDAGKSWPVLNLVSTVYPAGLLLSYVKQGFTGTAAR